MAFLVLLLSAAGALGCGQAAVLSSFVPAVLRAGAAREAVDSVTETGSCHAFFLGRVVGRRAEVPEPWP